MDDGCAYNPCVHHSYISNPSLDVDNCTHAPSVRWLLRGTMNIECPALLTWNVFVLQWRSCTEGISHSQNTHSHTRTHAHIDHLHAQLMAYDTAVRGIVCDMCTCCLLLCSQFMKSNLAFTAQTKRVIRLACPKDQLNLDQAVQHCRLSTTRIHDRFLTAHFHVLIQ